MFTKKVDKRSRVKMIAFLQNHFRYSTMNSWNNMTSYANCVKLSNLQIPSELSIKAYDFICAECDEYNNDIEIMRHEFYNKTGYTIGFNGRSGGYIVLYDTKLDDNDQVCILPHEIDQYEDFSDWSVDMLRERVELVQAFDKCCDDIRNLFIDYVANTTVKTVRVPRFEIKTVAVRCDETSQTNTQQI